MMGIELLERCLEQLYPPERVRNKLTVEKRQRCYAKIKATMSRSDIAREMLMEVYNSLGGYISPDRQISDDELLTLSYIADQNLDV